MATIDDVLTEVRALRAEIADLRAKETAPALRGVTLLARHLGAVPSAGASSSGCSAPGATPAAPDADLDSQYGDPEVRKDPKRWTGTPLAPRRMSQGTPEWLDAVAEFKDWQATQEEGKGDEGKKKAGFCRRDAARARGWAARLRKAPARCDGQHGGAPCTDPHCYCAPPPPADDDGEIA